jgi:hypothetical protein
MDLLIFLGCIFIIGFFVGQIYSNMITAYKIRQIFKTHNVELKVNELEEKLNNSIFELEVEKFENQLYLYTCNDRSFICQGKSLEELAKLCKEYKNIDIAEVQHENKFFLFNNGKIEEFHK